MKGKIGEFPQFVTLNGVTCLRLVCVNDNFSYYRDGGAWEVDFEKLKDGTLISASHHSGLSGCHLRPVTESKWKKCNTGYAPDRFNIYGFLPLLSTNLCNEIDLPKEVKENYEYLLIRR